MKFRIAILMLLAVQLCSCGGRGRKLDVKKVEVASETDWLKVNIAHSIMYSENPATNESCLVFNEGIGSFVSELQDQLKKKAVDFHAEAIRRTEIPEDIYFNLSIRDTVLMATDRYISLRLMADSYTGGAHGTTDFYAFNYDVAARKFLQPAEVVNFEKTDVVNAAIQSNFNGPDCFTEKPTLPLTTTINITPDVVLFTYGYYVLGPRVCGWTQVGVPRKDMPGAVLVK